VTSPGRRAAALALAGAGLLLLLVQTLPAPPCLQDDAYISLRYARHLAEGQGLVYNPGERVEGVTNFLWTVTLGLPFALGLPEEAFARWLGLLSGAGALAAGAWLAIRLQRDTLAGGLAVLLGGALPWLAAESIMGLETLAFAGLAVAGLARHQAEERDPDRRGWLSGGVLALAALTRPEGVLVAGLTGLSDVVRGRWRELRFWTRWVTFAVPVAALLAFRLAYYGDYVPNTFHAKVGGGVEAALRGLANAGAFFAAAAPLVILGLAAAGWLAARGGGGDRRLRLLDAHPAIVLVVHVAYVIWVGGDFKPTFRFFAVPSLLLAVLAGAGLVAWSRHAGGRWARGAVLALAAVPAVWAWIGGDLSREFVTLRARQIPVHRAAGEFLGEEFPPSSWIATGNAGLIPYASRLPTIDMIGLTDAHIAAREVETLGRSLAGHGKGDGGYVLRRAPRVILFQQARFSSRPLDEEQVARRLFSLSERELWNDERFHRRYRLVSTRLPGFYFNYFVRRPSPPSP
jgi:hypothetical protein